MESNQYIIEYVKQHGVDAATKHLIEKCHMKASFKSVLGNVTRTYKVFRDLSKSKGRPIGKQKLEHFLSEKFTCQSNAGKDKCDGSSMISKDVSDGSCVVSSSASTRSDPFASTDDPILKAEAYKIVAEKLSTELNQTRQDMLEMEEERDLAITEKDELNDSLDTNEKVLESNRKNLKRTANREAYWREKYNKMEEPVNHGNEVEILQTEIIQLKAQLSSKENQMKEMQSLVDELNIENIELKRVESMSLFDEDKNCYVPELHSCVYNLLDCQVSCENVSKVIDSVLKLCNKEANKLPSVSTINNWSIERALIARRQVADSSENEHTTLHTDEASKYGSKWGAFATRDSEGQYLLLGLRDMATKSSKDTMDTFKDILSDIDAASDHGTANKILCNIKNTMSDRASTETKFNAILKEYRETLLPEVINNFDAMTEESKQAISQMNNFFCGLHTLVHMADVSQQAALEVEKAHFDDNIPIQNPSFTKAGQPGTVRLILTACKAFARRGDQKSGCHGSFMTYISDFLKANKLLGLPLQPLRGNRFNILFANAGHVYFLKDQMLAYLEKTSSLNGLLLSVLHDLKEPVFVAGCKALGLVSKLITTPLWNIIEHKEVSISTMNHKYLQLLLYLDDISNNLDDFIKGTMILYNEVPIKKDVVYDSLVAPAEVDELVIIMLSVIIPALSKLIKRQYGDHLPGGQHEFVNEAETKSVDKHNKYPERVFAYVDHILSSKPNIQTLALEAQIAFSLNKTSEWLQNQENQNEIIIQSRSEVASERKRFRQREDTIKAKRIEKQEEDFRKKQEQERRRIQRLENETTDMLYYGLWQTAEQMEQELSKIKSKKEKEDALKVQLRFRKNVFQQTCDKENIYAFSRQENGKRVQLNVEELKQSVLKLIENAYHTPPPQQPHLLVGRKIQHKWLENEQPKWYKGTVISQVPGFPAWFNVTYDDDEAVYTAKLGEEYKTGDVVITEPGHQ